jgi:hypothetical protein
MNIYSVKWINIEHIRANGFPRLDGSHNPETNRQNVHTHPPLYAPAHGSTQHYGFS